MSDYKDDSASNKISDYEYDSGSDGDLTRTAHEVDSSFIKCDARRSLNTTFFAPRATIDESDDQSDLSVTNNDIFDSPMVAARRKNIRRLNSSDDSSENESSYASTGSRSEEISSHIESAQNEKASSPEELVDPILVLSSGDEEIAASFNRSGDIPVRTKRTKQPGEKPAQGSAGVADPMLVLSSEDEDFVVSPSGSEHSTIPSSTMPSARRLVQSFVESKDTTLVLNSDDEDFVESSSSSANPPIRTSNTTRPRENPGESYAAALEETKAESFIRLALI